MVRQTKKLIKEVSLSSAEEAFANYNGCVSKLSILEGEMNGEITKIKEKFDSRISKLQESKEEHFELMQCYAESNAELFEKKKSMEFTHGIIGFRTGTPKLKTLKGFTWASVLALIKGKKAMKALYVRTTEEVNKELLIANRELPSLVKSLPSLGLKIEQDEVFYVQPSLEEVAMA